MKTKDLVELVKSGVNPIIKIDDKHGVLEGPDPGMLGRVILVGAEDIWERGTSTISFTIDFSEFEEYNKSFAIPNWFDEFGNPTLKWMETKNYDAKWEIYEMYIEKNEYPNLSFIQVIDDNKWLNEYLKTDMKVSYPTFLESLLDKYINDKINN